MLRPRLAGLLALAVSGSAFPIERQTNKEPKGYPFSTEVVVIPVPVFVSDSQGQPVEGLKADDFVLKEEGKPQRISFFEPVLYDEMVPATSRQRRRPLTPGTQRQFLLLFDLTFASPRGLLRAREGALKFVNEQLAPSDLIAVATYSNLSGLRMLANFSADRAQARYAVESLGLLKSTDIIQDPVGFAFDPLLERPSGLGNVPQQLDERQAQLLENLKALADRMKKSEEEAYRSQASRYLGQFSQLTYALGSMSGRKFILLFSEGIDSRFLTGTGLAQFDEDLEKFLRGQVEAIDTDNRFGRADMRDLLMEGLQRAAASDVVIHALDISGLGGEAGDAPGKGEGGGQDSLYLMANETGGKLHKNLNDLSQPLASILKETRSYYLLGFHPQDIKERGRFRKIEVQVKRPGVRVSARRGYFEPKTADKLTDVEKKLQVVEYVSKDLLSEDVLFETLLATYPGQGSIVRVPVFLKFPGDQFLRGKRRSDILQLDLYGYAIDAQGHFIDFFSKALAFDLKKEQSRLEKAGFKYYDLLLARPGPVRIKIVARDAETGKVGSFIEDVDIPDFAKGDLVVSPPIFVTPEPGWLVTRGFDPNQPEPRRQGLPIAYPFRAEGQDFIPAIRPTVKQSEPTNLLVRVYNLKTHPTTGTPQTEMKFERIGPGGESVTLRRVGLLRSPEQPEPGCFELALQAQWSDTPPSAALFQMSLTDLLAKKTAQGSGPFVLIQ